MSVCSQTRPKALETLQKSSSNINQTHWGTPIFPPGIREVMSTSHQSKFCQAHLSVRAICIAVLSATMLSLFYWLHKSPNYHMHTRNTIWYAIFLLSNMYVLQNKMNAIEKLSCHCIWPPPSASPHSVWSSSSQIVSLSHSQPLLISDTAAGAHLLYSNGALRYLWSERPEQQAGTYFTCFSLSYIQTAINCKGITELLQNCLKEIRIAPLCRQILQNILISKLLWPGRIPRIFQIFGLEKLYWAGEGFGKFPIKNKRPSFQSYFHFRDIKKEDLCSQTFAFNIQSNDAQADDLGMWAKSIPFFHYDFVRETRDISFMPPVCKMGTIAVGWMGGRISLRWNKGTQQWGALQLPQQVARRMDTLGWVAL